MDKELQGRGGPGRGQGRHTLESKGLSHMKKEKVTIKLPRWLISQFRFEKVKSSLNRDKLILEAILEKTGWTPPN